MRPADGEHRHLPGREQRLLRDEVRVPAAVPPSSVTFSDLPTSAVPLGRLRVVNQVGKLGVYATTPVHREGLFHEIVLVPQANVQMIVRATDIHVMDDIVDSLQPVPAGFTVVPPCQRLMLRSAIERLHEAELGVKLIQASTLSGPARGTTGDAPDHRVRLDRREGHLRRPRLPLDELIVSTAIVCCRQRLLTVAVTPG